MNDTHNLSNSIPFDEETWQQLPDFVENLPEPVCLHVWGDETSSDAEREAVRLVKLLSGRFPKQISSRLLPRRINYPYYPVIGLMNGTAESSTDLGLRIIGLPIGFQMTTLITGIQAVAFRGQTLEPVTRIKLHRLMSLEQDVAIELLTSAEDESGAIVAKSIFGVAAGFERVRAFVIVTDFFPEAAQRYSAAYLPHVVINKRVHFDGVMGEDELVRQIRLALGKGKDDVAV